MIRSELSPELGNASDQSVRLAHSAISTSIIKQRYMSLLATAFYRTCSSLSCQRVRQVFAPPKRRNQTPATLPLARFHKPGFLADPDASRPLRRIEIPKYNMFAGAISLTASDVKRRGPKPPRRLRAALILTFPVSVCLLRDDQQTVRRRSEISQRPAGGQRHVASDSSKSDGVSFETLRARPRSTRRRRPRFACVFASPPSSAHPAEARVPVRRQNRVSRAARQHASREVPRAAVQLERANALQHDLVEINLTRS